MMMMKVLAKGYNISTCLGSVDHLALVHLHNDTCFGVPGRRAGVLIHASCQRLWFSRFYFLFKVRAAPLDYGFVQGKAFFFFWPPQKIPILLVSFVIPRIALSFVCPCKMLLCLVVGTGLKHSSSEDCASCTQHNAHDPLHTFFLALLDSQWAWLILRWFFPLHRGPLLDTNCCLAST